jgi:hypothetical protein
MLELLIRDAYRDWRSVNTDSAKIQAVTAEDIQRVAEKYFRTENKSVILYYTKAAEGGAEQDPLLSDLTEEDRAQVRQFRSMLAGASQEQAAQMLEAMRAQEASVPADKRKLMEVLVQLVEERVGAGSTGSAADPSEKEEAPPESDS